MSVTQSSPIYDAIDFGSEDDGIRRIGVFLAWVVNHRMLDESVERKSGHAAARVRMRDMRGSELLSTVCHGELTRAHLSAAGNEFAQRYYTADGYRAAYARAVADEKKLSISRDALASADGEWALYDMLAPEITRAHRGPLTPPPVAGQTLTGAKRKVASFLRLVK